MRELDLFYMMTQSTLVIKLVLAILIAMSLASWSLIFYKFFQFSRAKKGILKDLARLKAAGDLQSGFKHISDSPDSPAYFVALEGIAEIKRLIGIERPSGDRVPT